MSTPDMKFTITVTPMPDTAIDAVGEHLFDVLCEFAGDEIVWSVNGWEPVR